jgi:energy-converting hydrogenase Eha subunit F
LASRSEFEPNTGNAAAYLKNIVGWLNSGKLYDIGQRLLR